MNSNYVPNSISMFNMFFQYRNSQKLRERKNISTCDLLIIIKKRNHYNQTPEVNVLKILLLWLTVRKEYSLQKAADFYQ